MIYAVIYQLRKTDPRKIDTSVNDNITTAQEFLPFEDVRDGMVCLGGHRYRIYIECSSTNYNLKTDKEKEIIEISFQRFLNSLTFPVTIFIQTRKMDHSKMLSLLEEEIKESVSQYPQLTEYANAYYSEMLNLHSYIGNNKQKKKYIIVPYEEAINLPNLSDEEKYEYSLKEIYTRASMICDGLHAIGVRTKILNTKEVAELIFSTYHKDNYTHVENLVNGEFLTLMVEGERNPIETLSEDARLDWILYEAQMRIQNELLTEQTPDFMRKNFEYCIQQLNELRDKTSGYYKQRTEDVVIPERDHQEENRNEKILEEILKGGRK